VEIEEMKKIILSEHQTTNVETEAIPSLPVQSTHELDMLNVWILDDQLAPDYKSSANFKKLV